MDFKKVLAELPIGAQYILSQMKFGTEYKISTIIDTFTEYGFDDATTCINALIGCDPSLVKIKGEKIEMTVAGSLCAADTCFFTKATEVMASRTSDIDQDMAAGREGLIEILDRVDGRDLRRIVDHIEEKQRVQHSTDPESIEGLTDHFIVMFGILSFNSVLADWVSRTAEKNNKEQ